MDYAHTGENHTGENHTGENLPAQAPQAARPVQMTKREAQRERQREEETLSSRVVRLPQPVPVQPDGLDAACSYVYKYMLKGGSSATRISCQP